MRISKLDFGWRRPIPQCNATVEGSKLFAMNDSNNCSMLKVGGNVRLIWESGSHQSCRTMASDFKEESHNIIFLAITRFPASSM